jgi:hypothetical protein
MGDPFRPPLWRRGWVAVVAAFLGTAGFFAVFQHWWVGRRETLRAQTPEIISGTYLGTGAIVERRFQPGDTKAVFVRLDDGSKREFRFSGPGHWLEGCELGGPIALEKRGLALSIARSACPSTSASASKKLQE